MYSIFKMITDLEKLQTAPLNHFRHFLSLALKKCCFFPSDVEAVACKLCPVGVCVWCFNITAVNRKRSDDQQMITEQFQQDKIYLEKRGKKKKSTLVPFFYFKLLKKKIPIFSSSNIRKRIKL